MRIGIKLLRGPTEAVALALILQLTTGCPSIPVKLQTDGNSTWSEVVPLTIAPALLPMVIVVDPEGSSIRRNGVFEEIDPRYLVDLNRLTVERMPA